MTLEVEIVSVNTTAEIQLNSTLSTDLILTVANKLSDLVDVDTTDANDKYVIMYDAASQKYKLVNPDAVLNASVTEPIQPGLVGYASTFLNELDTDLDNRIDVDAGTF